jgi:hypothetical protein
MLLRSEVHHPAPFDPSGMLEQVPEGCSLEMSCRCPVTHLARGFLVARHGQQVTVRSLLKRWRCRTCGERLTALQ